MSTDNEVAVFYNDKLKAEDQIDAEERIAAYLFGQMPDDLDEEDCARLSKDILLLVLARFRRDLTRPLHVASVHMQPKAQRNMRHATPCGINLDRKQKKPLMTLEVSKVTCRTCAQALARRTYQVTPKGSVRVPLKGGSRG